MSSLWDVIGQACCDDGFRRDVMRSVKPGKFALGDLEELYEFFRTQTAVCPTRWELVEINRVLSLAGGDGGPISQISLAWDPAPRQATFFRIVGLGCVDAGLRGAMLAGSAEEARQALASGPPRQLLTASQATELRDLLQRKSGDKTVLDWMQEVELVGWIPTWNPDCEPGASYTATYNHANPLIISALQDVVPLKKYLASEPADRADRPAMRARVLQLLQEHPA